MCQELISNRRSNELILKIDENINYEKENLTIQKIENQVNVDKIMF